MKKLLVISIVALFAIALFSASSYLLAKESQTKVGWVTDTMCKGDGANAKHKECALKCVKEHGAKFAFYDNESKETFEIEPQAKAEQFAGVEVEVKGVFDAEKKMVKLESIKPLEKK